MIVADTSEFLGGLVIVLIVLFDVFQTVVLPRPTPVSLRPSGILVRLLYRPVRYVPLRSPRFREQLLGVFGPPGVLFVLLFWATLLVLGYGLQLHAFAAQIRPSAQ